MAEGIHQTSWSHPLRLHPVFSLLNNSHDECSKFSHSWVGDVAEGDLLEVDMGSNEESIALGVFRPYGSDASCPIYIGRLKSLSFLKGVSSWAQARVNKTSISARFAASRPAIGEVENSPIFFNAIGSPGWGKSQFLLRPRGQSSVSDEPTRVMVLGAPSGPNVPAFDGIYRRLESSISNTSWFLKEGASSIRLCCSLDGRWVLSSPSLRNGEDQVWCRCEGGLKHPADANSWEVLDCGVFRGSDSLCVLRCPSGMTTEVVSAGEGSTLEVPANTRVLKAWYGDGANSWSTKRGGDVTSTVVSRVSCFAARSARIAASNGDFGDRCHGVVKMLLVCVAKSTQAKDKVLQPHTATRDIIAPAIEDKDDQGEKKGKDSSCADLEVAGPSKSSPTAGTSDRTTTALPAPESVGPVDLVGEGFSTLEGPFSLIGQLLPENCLQLIVYLESAPANEISVTLRTKTDGTGLEEVRDVKTSDAPAIFSECRPMTTEEADGFLSKEFVWKAIEARFLDPPTLPLEKTGSPPPDDPTKYEVVSVKVPCWDDSACPWIRQPVLKPLAENGPTRTTPAAMGMKKKESEHHQGMFVTDLPQRIGSSVAVRTRRHTALRVEFPRGKAQPPPLLIPVTFFAKASGVMETVSFVTQPTRQDESDNVSAINVPEGKSSTGGTGAAASAEVGSTDVEGLGSSTEDSRTGNSSWGNFLGSLGVEGVDTSAPGGQSVLAAKHLVKGEGGSAAVCDISSLPKFEVSACQGVEVPRAVVERLDTDKHEVVVGTVAAAAPWLGGGSALVAIAVPPSEPLNDQRSEDEHNGGSGGGGSGAVGVAPKKDDGEGADEEDDDDSESDCEDPAWLLENPNALAVRRREDRQQRASRRAAGHTSPGSSRTSQPGELPASFLDPVKHFTGVPLKDWDAVLVADESESGFARDETSPESSFRAITAWLSSSTDPLIQEHRTRKARLRQEESTNLTSQAASVDAPSSSRFESASLSAAEATEPVLPPIDAPKLQTFRCLERPGDYFRSMDLDDNVDDRQIAEPCMQDELVEAELVYAPPDESFLPTMSPPDRPAAWLDASQPKAVEVSEDGHVTRWRDRSGGMRHVGPIYGAATPTWSTAEEGINGHCVVRFGPETALVCDRSCAVRTVAFVVAHNAVRDEDTIFSRYQDRNFSVRAMRSGYRAVTSDYSYYTSRASAKLWVNGEKGQRQEGQSWSGSVLSKPLVVVCLRRSVELAAEDKDFTFQLSTKRKERSFSGDLAELLVYDRELTLPEVRQLQRYLEQKWQPPEKAGAERPKDKEGKEWLQVVLPGSRPLFLPMCGADGRKLFAPYHGPPLQAGDPVVMRTHATRSSQDLSVPRMGVYVADNCIVEKVLDGPLKKVESGAHALDEPSEQPGLNCKRAVAKIMTRVHPGMTLEDDALKGLESSCLTVLELLVEKFEECECCPVECEDPVASPVSADEVCSALHSVLSGEVKQRAALEGETAVRLFSSHERRRDVDQLFSADDLREKVESMLDDRPRCTHEASIFISAVLSSVMTVCCDLGGQRAADRKRDQVLVNDLLEVVRDEGDMELFEETLEPFAVESNRKSQISGTVLVRHSDGLVFAWALESVIRLDKSSLKGAAIVEKAKLRRRAQEAKALQRLRPTVCVLNGGSRNSGSTAILVKFHHRFTAAMTQVLAQVSSKGRYDENEGSPMGLPGTRSPDLQVAMEESLLLAKARAPFTSFYCVNLRAASRACTFVRAADNSPFTKEGASSNLEVSAEPPWCAQACPTVPPGLAVAVETGLPRSLRHHKVLGRVVEEGGAASRTTGSSRRSTGGDTGVILVSVEASTRAFRSRAASALLDAYPTALKGVQVTIERQRLCRGTSDRIESSGLAKETKESLVGTVRSCVSEMGRSKEPDVKYLVARTDGIADPEGLFEEWPGLDYPGNDIGEFTLCDSIEVARTVARDVIGGDPTLFAAWCSRRQRVWLKRDARHRRPGLEGSVKPLPNQHMVLFYLCESGSEVSACMSSSAQISLMNGGSLVDLRHIPALGEGSCPSTSSTFHPRTSSSKVVPRTSSSKVVSSAVRQFLHIDAFDGTALGWRGIRAYQFPPSAVDTLSPVHKHFGECSICYDLKPLKSPSVFAQFCFRQFRITGDSKNISDPRHLNCVCKPCLKQHATTAIKSGRLFVACPAEGCGRSLQTLELADVLEKMDYEVLVTRLKEAEDAAAASGELEAHPLGLELRRCVKCSVPIEKNEGCSQMQCYRCGEKFSWSSAARIEPPKPKKVSGSAALYRSRSEFGDNKAAYVAYLRQRLEVGMTVRVLDDEALPSFISEGDSIVFDYDDGSRCPRFRNLHGRKFFCDLWSLEMSTTRKAIALSAGSSGACGPRHAPRPDVATSGVTRLSFERKRTIILGRSTGSTPSHTRAGFCLGCGSATCAISDGPSTGWFHVVSGAPSSQSPPKVNQPLGALGGAAASVTSVQQQQAPVPVPFRNFGGNRDAYMAHVRARIGAGTAVRVVRDPPFGEEGDVVVLHQDDGSYAPLFRWPCGTLRNVSLFKVELDPTVSPKDFLRSSGLDSPALFSTPFSLPTPQPTFGGNSFGVPAGVPAGVSDFDQGPRTSGRFQGVVEYPAGTGTHVHFESVIMNPEFKPCSFEELRLADSWGASGLEVRAVDRGAAALEAEAVAPAAAHVASAATRPPERMSLTTFSHVVTTNNGTSGVSAQVGAGAVTEPANVGSQEQLSATRDLRALAPPLVPLGPSPPHLPPLSGPFSNPRSAVSSVGRGHAAEFETEEKAHVAGPLEPDDDL